MWPTEATTQEIAAALPSRTISNIKNQAHYLGVRRPSRPLRHEVPPVIEQIKARARYLNMSMADVDALARSKKYFRQHGWIRHAGINGKAVAAAIMALDGEVRAVWKE